MKPHCYLTPENNVIEPNLLFFQKYGPLQNIDIVQADPDNRLSVQLGQFQLIVLFKVLNTLSNPEAVLAPLHNFLGTGGFLMIVSDYNWTRFTNRVSRFPS